MIVLFYFIYIGLDLLHFCVKVCYAERSEANGFIIKKNAVVLNEVKLRFSERSELGLMF